MLLLANNVQSRMGPIVPSHPEASRIGSKTSFVGLLERGEDLILGNAALPHPFYRVFIEGDNAFAKNFIIDFLDDGHTTVLGRGKIILPREAPGRK